MTSDTDSLRTDTRPQILMLAANDCRNDARVLKQADAVHKAGFATLILADNDDGNLSASTTQDGLHFSRLDTRDRRAPALPIENELFPKDKVQRAFRRQHHLLQLRILAERIRKTLSMADKLNEMKLERRRVEQAMHCFNAKRHIFYLRNVARHWQKIGQGQAPLIIQAHDLYTLPAGIWLKHETGARLIYDAHEYEPGRYNFTEPERSAFAALENRAFAHVDHIITVGRAIADLYAERFAGPSPTVIHNTPKIGTIDDGKDLRKRCGLGLSDSLIAYTGRVHGEGRGLNIVLESMRQLDEIHLAILGQRDERHDRWLMEQAVALGLDNRVHLLAPVAPDEVVAAVRGADLGLCLIQDMALSYRYSMPNKLFEMTFADMPVIVSNLPEMSAFVKEIGNGEIVDQTDPRSITRAIKRILADPGAYRPNNEAKKRLSSIYSWQAQADRIAKLYAELIAKP